MSYQINFPHLGIFLEHVPQSFNIGSFSIAMYGVMIALGMIVGLTIATWRAKETNQKEDTYIDIFLLIVLFGISGARIYYVIFQWDYYSKYPLEIFNLRQGGLAIYGGIILAIVAMAVYSKRKKINVLQVLDTVIMGVLAGQIIGRWGNFFNREVFGGYTDGLLAMQLPLSFVRSGDVTQEMLDHLVNIGGVDFISVHPTFLYEGLWNLGVLILIFIFRDKIKFHGENFFRYCIGYGLGRFWIEYIRTDQLYITGTHIPVSMVVSFGAVAIGVVGIIIGCKHAKADFDPRGGAAVLADGKAEESIEEVSDESAE
ncbi:MAG: prolipoprotein diacylglyceryl transferase [Lachnospiraceae bacterium]|nr:prolipoprotein diacylglyceryl transferase [Candidatus Equihabitans merdae]